MEASMLSGLAYANMKNVLNIYMVVNYQLVKLGNTLNPFANKLIPPYSVSSFLETIS